MFHLSDFLIYCFITAYTPGANNLLSMSNAVRLGFRKSIRFNFGILAGFSVVMAVCTIFSAALYSLLPKVKPVMQIAGGVYMLYLAWKVLRSTADLDAGQKDGAGFSLRHDPAVFQSQDIYLCNNHNISLYSSSLPFTRSIGRLRVLLSLIGASGSFVWALFGAAFCNFFSRHTKAVNLVMALLLVYCAAVLFI